ncbi:HAD family hydrolase [Streptomyces xiamenensis]|uniref:HAD family hydrolase n=1 Tax=Streptomyces xiamenensis TaxID=408015 RepID=UPI0036E50F26
MSTPPRAAPPRAVIFDLDGTLVDTPALIAELTGGVLAERGHRVSREAVRATVGLPLAPSMARLMGLPEEDPEVAAAVTEYGARFGRRVHEAGAGLLFPGVAEGLGRLSDAGLPLAIATSKVAAAASAIARLTGVDARMSVIAGHDSVAHGKPAPDMAHYVAERLGVPAGACTVVGDGVPDAAMGRAAGMPVLGVSYGVSTAEQLTDAGAVAVVDSFPAVVTALLARVR